MKTKTGKIAIIGMWTAVVCVMAVISIPMPPIPFTLALLAIFLTGALFSPKYAFASVIAYLLLGAVGVPVFSGFKSGIGTLFGVTGGYLMAYPLIALIVSTVNKYSKHKAIALPLGMLLGLAVCYFLGTAWFVFAADSNWIYALSVCVLPFAAFDLLKIALASVISLALDKTPVKNYLF